MSGVYISGIGIVAGCHRFGDSVPRNYNNHKIYESRRDFQQCGVLTSVDSEEPVQPPFKLRNSKW